MWYWARVSVITHTEDYRMDMMFAETDQVWAWPVVSRHTYTSRQKEDKACYYYIIVWRLQNLLSLLYNKPTHGYILIHLTWLYMHGSGRQTRDIHHWRERVYKVIPLCIRSTPWLFKCSTVRDPSYLLKQLFWVPTLPGDLYDLADSDKDPFAETPSCKWTFSRACKPLHSNR